MVVRIDRGRPPTVEGELQDRRASPLVIVSPSGGRTEIPPSEWASIDYLRESPPTQPHLRNLHDSWCASCNSPQFDIRPVKSDEAIRAWRDAGSDLLKPRLATDGSSGLYDNGLKSAQGHVLTLAGAPDCYLVGADTRFADIITAEVLGIPLVHVHLLKFLNDQSKEPAVLELGLEKPNLFFGRNTAAMMNFCLILEAYDTSDWSRVARAWRSSGASAEDLDEGAKSWPVEEVDPTYTCFRDFMYGLESIHRLTGEPRAERFPWYECCFAVMAAVAEIDGRQLLSATSLAPRFLPLFFDSEGRPLPARVLSRPRRSRSREAKCAVCAVQDTIRAKSGVLRAHGSVWHLGDSGRSDGCARCGASTIMADRTLEIHEQGFRRYADFLMGDFERCQNPWCQHERLAREYWRHGRVVD